MPEYKVNQKAVALVAATAKTVLQLATPASRRLELVEFGVSFNGVTASDVPALVELVRQTSAGTMSAETVAKLDPADPAALVTAQHTATVEPTDSGDVVFEHYVTPVGGLFIYQFAKPLALAVSAWLGLRITPTGNVSCCAHMQWRE